MSNIYQFDVPKLGGNSQPMEDYKGKVLLVVNTASKCGFTPQYKGLESLYKEYKDKGLMIVGFPCNQFGKQEPGSDSEISEFCELNYGVSFPMASKIDVNGDSAHPIYTYLKAELPGVIGSKRIKWNFTKFLINRDGKPVKRYAPNVKPEDIAADIKALL
jgi:glutathione peroxidase